MSWFNRLMLSDVGIKMAAREFAAEIASRVREFEGFVPAGSDPVLAHVLLEAQVRSLIEERLRPKRLVSGILRVPGGSVATGVPRCVEGAIYDPGRGRPMVERGGFSVVNPQQIKKTLKTLARIRLDPRAAKPFRKTTNSIIRMDHNFLNTRASRGSALVMFLATILPVLAADWPQFRGQTGLGYTEEKNLPLTWGGPTNENVLWKAPLPGQGHASPIVWGDAVFVCTAYWPPTVTVRAKVIPEHHITCYQATEGKVLWDTLVPPGPWLRSDFRSGPGGGYAAVTPATDGKMVYCAFGSSVLAALDFQGKIIWRKEIVPYTFDVAMASSPVLYADTVILFCASQKSGDSRIIAFDKATGEMKWQQMFPDMGFGHSTPVIIPVEGKPQMLVLASGMKETGNALRSLDPATGKVLWWCRGAGDTASPAYASGLVYFEHSRGGLGIAVDPTGSGDVSDTHIKWTVKFVPEGLSSPVIVGRYVYRLHTPGILKCWEVTTGNQVYSEKLERISSTWASPIADPNGRLFFANSGRSYVIQSGPEFRVLAINDLDDSNHASPAVAGGKFFLVGTNSLYSIGKRE
jgi:outer membrane protein assembly factor BamB